MEKVILVFLKIKASKDSSAKIIKVTKKDCKVREMYQGLSKEATIWL